MAYDKKTTAKAEEKKVYESKSFAEMQTVEPSEGQRFEPFKKIFAWKTTKRFGFISIEAFKNKEQKTLSGDPVEKGFEKWYVKVKTGISVQTVSAIFNTKKKMLSFQLGNTKCAVSPSKGYFSFVMPEAVKNAKLRK